MPCMETPEYKTVGIVGAGAMGRGIAQIAAQAGSTVLLFDTQAAAIEQARAAIAAQWDRMVEKASCPADAAAGHKARLLPAATLAELEGCDLVVEAIVERLDVKKSLFAELEGIVGEQAVLATNTSSLSVTAIAADLQRPQRFAGYHFFNPVPLMKVVEVIAGLKTDAAVCQRLATYARQMGHTPVQAGDTPGFIVNHAGRGYGTEALRIVSEGVADFATIDRILKDQMGFRLGPFELFDLTALDVSHPVMESIYRQYYDEPRYRPSVITAQAPGRRRGGQEDGRRFLQVRRRQCPGRARTAGAAGGRDAAGVGVHPRRAPRRAVPAAERPGRQDRDRPVALAPGADAGGAAGLSTSPPWRWWSGSIRRAPWASTCWWTTRPPNAACWPPTRPPAPTCATPRTPCSPATARPSA